MPKEFYFTPLNEELSMKNIADKKIINGKGIHPKLASKHKLSDEYILKSAVQGTANAKLAVSLSNNEIIYFDAINKAKSKSIKGHEKSITGLKFGLADTLYSSSLDGKILVRDLRSGWNPVITFSDETDGDLKPIVCFDYNADEGFLAAGTELIREDAFIIFWDMRTTKNVGGYWNSHTDEITQVQFHPTCNSNLSSSSLDGLINIFDLNEGSEDDALINTLNIETSVNRFSWNSKNFISCITGTEEFQFWSTEKTSPTLTTTREELADKYKCDVDCLIDTFCAENSFYLASGSNAGTMHLYKNENGLKQVAILEDGHTDVIRTMSYCWDGNLITGGEDGQLCIWKTLL